MATPGTAPWLIPAPQLSDSADIETAVVPLRDRVQVLFGQQQALIDAISANDWVTAARIATGAVGSSEIADLSVGTAELAADAVTAAKIAKNRTNCWRTNPPRIRSNPRSTIVRPRSSVKKRRQHRAVWTPPHISPS